MIEVHIHGTKSPKGCTVAVYRTDDEQNRLGRGIGKLNDTPYETLASVKGINRPDLHLKILDAIESVLQEDFTNDEVC